MSEVLESRLPPPLDTWDADDELESLCKIALWVGHEATDDSLDTFTTLLVALFGAEDATSQWFQAQAATRNVDVGGVCRSRGLRIEQLPSLAMLAQSGALPVSTKNVWTQSARYFFVRAAKLRSRVTRAALTSRPQLWRNLLFRWLSGRSRGGGMSVQPAGLTRAVAIKSLEKKRALVTRRVIVDFAEDCVAPLLIKAPRS